MKHLLHTMPISNERDVVNARQQARSVAESLGYEHTDQIRIATAVSEIARNAFRYATGGSVTFSVNREAGQFSITVTDTGGGIPHLQKVMSGTYRSSTGMGMGIVGTRRLMDTFDIQSSPKGTIVEMTRALPEGRTHAEGDLEKIASKLRRPISTSTADELQIQNRELLQTLNELRERKDELQYMNAELQDTNRGVVALYAELDERADYLRRASELKSNFLSNMSHEFRTPLNSILALTRMLLDRMDGELNIEQDQQLRFIQQSARELAEMVDDLLDLAKVEAGRLEIKAREFSVAELFGALRGMLKPLLAGSSLSLIFEPADDLEVIYNDEQKISQILRNFISNAIKFTPEGEVRVTAERFGEEIDFSVSDTGIGIAESDQQIIFEEFGQVDSAVQHRVKGTGLGLPLSRKLAELLGGRVEVQSSPGRGSRFRLIMPANLLRGPSEPDSLPSLQGMDAERLVLAVEDNPETVLVYKRYLSQAGFQVLAARSDAGARATLKSVRPAAIILDVMLHAEMSWALLSYVKEHAPEVPVIVVSVTESGHRAIGAGADAFLAKPFEPEQLLSELLRMLERPARKRLLLIDDNEVSRYLLRQYIPDEHFEVFEARSGREGLQLARDVKPALIVLDFYMPDMTGDDVLTHLRAEESLRDVPVILHTTRAITEAEKEKLRERNAAVFSKDCLTLPDAGEQFGNLVQSLLTEEAHAA